MFKFLVDSCWWCCCKRFERSSRWMVVKVEFHNVFWGRSQGRLSSVQDSGRFLALLSCHVINTWCLKVIWLLMYQDNLFCGNCKVPCSGWIQFGFRGLIDCCLDVWVDLRPTLSSRKLVCVRRNICSQRWLWQCLARCQLCGDNIAGYVKWYLQPSSVLAVQHFGCPVVWPAVQDFGWPVFLPSSFWPSSVLVAQYFVRPIFWLYNPLGMVCSRGELCCWGQTWVEMTVIYCEPRHYSRSKLVHHCWLLFHYTIGIGDWSVSGNGCEFSVRLFWSGWPTFPDRNWNPTLWAGTMYAICPLFVGVPPFVLDRFTCVSSSTWGWYVSLTACPDSWILSWIICIVFCPGSDQAHFISNQLSFGFGIAFVWIQFRGKVEFGEFEFDTLLLWYMMFDSSRLT